MVPFPRLTELSAEGGWGWARREERAFAPVSNAVWIQTHWGRVGFFNLFG